MRRPTMSDTACELIDAAPGRALSFDAIVDAIVARGQTSSRTPRVAVRQALNESRRLEELHDGRWVRPMRLLDGMVLTHELTPAEAAAGAIGVSPDVAPLWMLIVREPMVTPDGHPIESLVFSEAAARLGPDHDRAIVGPPGWLPDRPGALLAFRVSGPVVSVEPAPPVSPSARIAERRLGTAALRCLQEDPLHDLLGQEVLPIEHVVVNTLVDAPDLLREPMHPLSEVLAAAGLESRGTEVGLPGTDWARRAWPRIAAAITDAEREVDELDIDTADIAEEVGLSGEIERLTEVYDLDEWEVEATTLLLTSLELHGDPTRREDRDQLRACASLLREPILAEMLADQAWGDPGAERVIGWASAIIGVSGPRDTAGARFVLASALEAAERMGEAEAELRRAIQGEPRFVPALTALASFEEDRNADAAAVALLRKARIPRDDGQRAWLEAIAKSGGPRPSPGARLVRKVHAWAERPDVDAAVHALLGEVGLDPDGASDEDDDPWWLSHALGVDMLLFERGELDRFLRVRGSLLPAVERDLARAWRSTRRSLLEVRAIRPDAGITLVDVDTGRVTDVTDAVLPRQVPLGTLLCARLLSDGAGSHLADASFTVDGSEETALLDLLDRPDSFDLLAWVAGQGLVPWAPIPLPVPPGGGPGPGPGSGPRRTPGHA